MGHSQHNKYEHNDFGYKEGYIDGGTRIIRPFSPTNTTIQETIIVPSASNSGLLFVQYVTNVNVTVTDGNLMTLETFSFLPLTNAHMWVNINGLDIFPANGTSEVSTSAFYITDSTNTIVRPKGTYQIGDVFRWNGSVANYQLDGFDTMKIIYQI